MRETLLHISETLDASQRQALCAALGQIGADCDSRFQSESPNLLFVRFDRARAEPGALVETVERQGYRCQIVDL